MLAVISPTAEVSNFVILSVTPGAPVAARRRTLLGAIVQQDEKPAGSLTGVILYKFSAATTNSAGLFTVLKNAVSSGQFTSWLRSNGYPAATVSSLPEIEVLAAPPSESTKAEPYVWVVGVVVGFAVLVYLIWSGSRRIRERNAQRKQRGEDTSSNNGDERYSTVSALGISVPSSAARRMRRHETDYSLDVDLEDIGPLQQHQQQRQEQQRQEQQRQEQQRQQQRQRPPPPPPPRPSGAGGASSAYNDVFVRPRIFTPERGDADFQEGMGGMGGTAGSGRSTENGDYRMRDYDGNVVDDDDIILI